MREEQPDRVSFPRITWIVMAGFGLVMLGMLALQLLVIADQRRLTSDQRALVTRQLRLVAPLIAESRPLVRDVQRGLPRTRAIARRADRLTRAATPVVAQLDGAQLARTAVSAGRLSDALLRAEAPALVTQLSRMARDTTALLDDVRTRRLVERSANAARIAPKLYLAQRQALALQRRQLAVAEQTLVVAREAARHAASLDRKLLGELPAPAAGR